MISFQWAYDELNKEKILSNDVIRERFVIDGKQNDNVLMLLGCKPVMNGLQIIFKLNA